MLVWRNEVGDDVPTTENPWSSPGLFLYHVEPSATELVVPLERLPPFGSLMHKQTRYDLKLAAVQNSLAHYPEHVAEHMTRFFERQVLRAFANTAYCA